MDIHTETSADETESAPSSASDSPWALHHPLPLFFPSKHRWLPCVVSQSQDRPCLWPSFGISVSRCRGGVASDSGIRHSGAPLPIHVWRVRDLRWGGMLWRREEEGKCKC